MTYSVVLMTSRQNATHGGCRPIPPGGDVVDATDVGADSALNTFRAPFAIVHPHKTKVMLCDDRLASLDITFWTTVPISSDFAARIISLYLQTDHPLLGTFDPDSFVSDLVENETTSCSSFVVNALLYWGCVSNTSKPSLISIADPSRSKCIPLSIKKPTITLTSFVPRPSGYGMSRRSTIHA